jgi:hypothetical protein
MGELELYRLAAGIYEGNTNDDLWEWWVNRVDDLPRMKFILQIATIMQPSSAAAERVFSMVQALFNDNQDQALEDMK